MRAKEFLKIDEDYRDAARYAAKAHTGQKRSGGKPYISHPVRVANLVRKYKDSESLNKLMAAAFLHDTIEDTDTTEEQLRKMFGDLVASLVSELTSDKDQIEKIGSKAEYLAQKMIHMSSWALVIKLADRLDNVSDIKTAKSAEWRKRYKAETESILNQIERKRKLSGTHQNLIAAIRSKLAELSESVTEADASQVGRKYQHIEDLVFTNGSKGGLHAVERLRHMGEEGGHIELKWDGLPVVYWGRDEDGTFRMVPKNAWEYAKRGKLELDNGVNVQANSPQDVAAFITGTGRVDPDKEKERQQYAGQLAQLWPLLEKASPKKGYLEGGILFWPAAPPKLNKQTNEYDFQPNITEFHVAADSELGKKISKAKVMIAATGYYDSFGSGNEGRLDNVQSLSTGDVIVQGTTYVQEPPKLDTTALENIEKFIKENATSIDKFLESKPGLKSPATVIYNFLNKNLRGTNLIEAFKAWAKENLSTGQFEKIMADLKGLGAILRAVEMITAVKEQMITDLSNQTHSGIRQTKPEGYAQAYPQKDFKNALPGQFVKTISQQTWAPRKL